MVFHSFEVESVEARAGDFILDVKVLPDRAHDCLSHRGTARELAVHLVAKTVFNAKPLPVSSEKPKRELKISVNEPVLCRRYAGLAIENIKIGPSPSWLKERLLSIGQKSINNIVDATNFVMFDFGQPLHAFDADKVTGNISVRKAKGGEKITTLDGKEVILDENMLVIADDESPLAIAGIKGGKKAEVNVQTRNIILEAANFSPASVRKTSKRLGIQTDSSKRFENELSPEMTREAIETVANLILQIAGGSDTKVGDINDFYPRPPSPYVVGISAAEASGILGVKITQGEMESTLKKLGFKHVMVNPIEEVISLSQKLVGVPYKYGASIVYDAPKAFDCSSFAAYLFAQAGVAIPRMAVDQYAFGEEIDTSELEPGDMVFSNTGEGKIYYETVEFMKGTKITEGLDHCGIYLGDGKVIHATRAFGKVIIENLSESGQFKNIVGYRKMAGKEPRIAVTVPPERLDIRLKENLIEEIGKVYGYDKIIPAALPPAEKAARKSKSFFYANKIRAILSGEGFSEVLTSSFADKGKAAVDNPIASDKGFLKENLSGNLFKSLELNLKNAPLLGLQKIKVFEIGKVFGSIPEEKTVLAIGVSGKKSREEAERAAESLTRELKTDFKRNIKQSGANTVAEIDLDEIIEKLSEPAGYEGAFLFKEDDLVYRKISPYPFVLRDIALWAPQEVDSNTILELIQRKAGELLVKISLFDVFEKDGRRSYAFRLVFLSNDKTLTDEEVNKIMEAVSGELTGHGFEVR